MGNTIFNQISSDELERNLFATADKIIREKSERLELVEEFKKDLKKLDRAINHSMKKRNLQKYYYEYVRLGGESEQKEFKKHLRRFFELTLNVFVYGSCLNIDGTYCDGRDAAWKSWVDYIKNNDEADLYFGVVNNITPYT